MRQRNFGRIVNTCSAAGILGAPRMSNYGAAKTGLIGLTRVLAAEAADLDIKINAIAPVAATRMMDYSMGSAADVDNPVRTEEQKQLPQKHSCVRSSTGSIPPWWPRWWRISPTRTARSPVRSTRSAAARSPGSSSAGPRATTTRP